MNALELAKKLLEKFPHLKTTVSDTVSGTSFLDVSDGTVGFTITCDKFNHMGLTKLPADFGCGPDENFINPNLLIKRLTQSFDKDWFTRRIKRAYKVLEIAARVAKEESRDWEVLSRVDEMQIHPGYAEPGYNSQLVVTGNWNSVTRYDKDTKERVKVSNLPERLSAIFEKMGFETEWYDEWHSCDECQRIFRQEPDSYGWKPSFVEYKDSILCMNCFKDSPGDALFHWAKNHSSVEFNFELDPSEHGYVEFLNINLNHKMFRDNVLSQNTVTTEIKNLMKEKGIRYYFWQEVEDDKKILWMDEDEYEDLTLNED